MLSTNGLGMGYELPVHFRYQELMLPHPTIISLGLLLGHELLPHAASVLLTTECPWTQHLYRTPVSDMHSDKLEVMVTCMITNRGNGDIYSDRHGGNSDMHDDKQMG